MTAPVDGIPEPFDNDDDDVAWALQTATVQWKRESYSDALDWLRRAVEYAIEAGHAPRASELSRAVSDLNEALRSSKSKASVTPPSVIPPPRNPAVGVAVGEPIDDEPESIEEIEEVEPDSEDDIIHPSDILDEEEGSAVPALSTKPPPPSMEARDGQPSPAEGQDTSAAAVESRQLPGAETPDETPLEETPSPPAPDLTEEDDAGPTEPPSAGPDDFEIEEALVLDPIKGPAENVDDLDDPTLDAPVVRESREHDYDPLEAPLDAAEQPLEEDELPDLDDDDDEMTHVDALPSDMPAAPRPPAVPSSTDTEIGVPGVSKLDDEFEADLGEAAGAIAVSAEPVPVAGEPELAGRHDEEAPAEPVPVAGELELAGKRDEEAPASELLVGMSEPPRSVDPQPTKPAEPTVLGVKLADVRGFEDLPEESQSELAKAAKLEVLQPDEELSFFAVALVVKGDVSIVPAVSDIPCGYANKGDIIFTQGNLAEGVALSVTAGPDGAAVAAWNQEALERATAECPWVADELREVADRYQALAGATMGPLGERLDESLLANLFDKCDVRLYLANDVLLEAGNPIQGMYILGAGRVLIGDEELAPGDLVFPSCTPSNSPVPSSVVAGDGGAVVLHVNAHNTHELMVMLPPLLEILAMG